MANPVNASAFLDVTLFFPRDAFMLVAWMLARDEAQEQLYGRKIETTVWDVCDAVANMSGMPAAEVEEKFRGAGIDMEGCVTRDVDQATVLERIMHEEGDDDSGEFMSEDDEFFDGEAPSSTGSEPPEWIVVDFSAKHRKLILKHGKPQGQALALLDQNTRNPLPLTVRMDLPSFMKCVLNLTEVAVKLKGPKYDELSELVGLMLGEAAEQGLELPE